MSQDRKMALYGLFFCIVVVIVLLLIASRTSQARSMGSEKENEIKPLSNAILYLAQRYKNPLTKDRADQLAGWFIRYGERWKVDPWLAVCIACQESVFRDRPRRVFVNRCKTEIKDDKAVRVCKKIWPGELGMMQVIPVYARKSFRQCFGRRWRTTQELLDTKTNICVGINLMSLRRQRIQKRIQTGRSFVARGNGLRWVKKYAPCSWRQRRFCKNGYQSYCKKWWWVASWNWGYHRVICGKTSRVHDFDGYPIKIIRRYRTIVEKFRK